MVRCFLDRWPCFVRGVSGTMIAVILLVIIITSSSSSSKLSSFFRLSVLFSACGLLIGHWMAIDGYRKRYTGL
jgi:hypothetical protein